jgi:hypothetical protein
MIAWSTKDPAGTYLPMAQIRTTCRSERKKHGIKVTLFPGAIDGEIPNE